MGPIGATCSAGCKSPMPGHKGQASPFRDYMTCLIAILEGIEPPLALDQQVDLLLRKLRPELQKMMRRTDNLTIAGLLDSTTEAELVLDAE